MKQFIQTEQAPAAIGTYSQAVKHGKTVYVSGQIAMSAESAELISDEFAEQAHQVFANLKAIASAAGGSLQDFVKLNVYLSDLSDFVTFNQVMAEYFSAPYPARAVVEVARLPKDARVEVEGVLITE